jgi:drug/metabolite transporter (DMT)-like permease
MMIIAAILWSTGGLLVKSIDWHPMAIASSRSIIAITIIYFYMKREQKKSTVKRPIITFNKTSILGGISYAMLGILFITATKLTTAANTIILQFTSPIWVVLFSVIFLKKYVRKEEILSILVVFIGIALFFVDSIESGHMLGDLLGIFSGVAMASTILLMKQDPDINPIEITLIGNIIVVILGVGFIYSQTFTFANIAIVLFLGIFQLGLPYILFCKSLVNLTAIDGVLIPILEPILNPLWVFLLQGETISTTAMLGAGIVISSVVFHTLSDAKRLKKA